MITVRRISGNSMDPLIQSGDTVIFRQAPLKTGMIVLARVGTREVVKRIKYMDEDGAYLLGENTNESTDSRHYGKIARSAILGSVMIVLPKAVNPPKLSKPYGQWLGRGAAVVLVLMALVHLYRIDTFIPILNDYLPGGNGLASSIALLVILSEIFAIPFAFRMRLSPLAHIVSGALLALAPLWWVLIDIWMLGLPQSTGQLGEFVAVPSVALVLVLNTLWVGYNYYTLYALGYNRLKISTLLRK